MTERVVMTKRSRMPFSVIPAKAGIQSNICAAGAPYSKRVIPGNDGEGGNGEKEQNAFLCHSRESGNPVQYLRRRRSLFQPVTGEWADSKCYSSKVKNNCSPRTLKLRIYASPFSEASQSAKIFA